MLAKLKVVSVLESLPGVGKVHARKHHGRARHLREPPAPRARRPTSARRAARRSSRRRLNGDGSAERIAEPRRPARPRRARRAPARARSASGCASAIPTLRWSVSWTTRRAAAGRGRRRRLPLRRPARSSSACATPAGSSSGSRSTATSRARPASPWSSTLAAGHDVLLEIDVQGALAVRGQHPGGRCSCSCGRRRREEQRRRLEARGSRRPRRRSSAGWPGPRPRSSIGAEQFDAVVVNDDVDRAVAELAAILEPAGRPAEPTLRSPIRRAPLPRLRSSDGRTPRLADGAPDRDS